MAIAAVTRPARAGHPTATNPPLPRSRPLLRYVLAAAWQTVPV